MKRIGGDKLAGAMLVLALTLPGCGLGAAVRDVGSAIGEAIVRDEPAPTRIRRGLAAVNYAIKGVSGAAGELYDAGTISFDEKEDVADALDDVLSATRQANAALLLANHVEAGDELERAEKLMLLASQLLASMEVD